MAKEKLLLSAFLVLSVLAALTEGVGVSLVVPILESQANQSVFTNIPILKEFSNLFEGLNPNDKLRNVSIVLAVVWILRGCLLYCVELLGGIIPLKLQRGLYARGYEALLRAEYSFFMEKNIGEHLSSLTEWATRVTQLLTSFAIAINALILVIVYLVLMVTISWKLALSAVVFVILITSILKLFISGPLHRVGEKMSHKNIKLSDITHETMTGMKFIKTSAAEDTMVPEYNDRLTEKIDTQIKMVAYQALTNPFLVTTAGLFICVLLYGFSAVNNEAASWISGLLMFIIVLTRLLSPISQLNSARAQFFAHYFSLEMLDKFFKETDLRKEQLGQKEFKTIKENIVFDDVEFKYPNSEKNVICGLSMELKKGQMIAVVGPSGSGKSTIVALLMRLFNPQKGSIKIDGIDLQDIDVRDLRRVISLVSQDIFIFNDTVKENVIFSIDDVTDEAIEKAADLAAANEFIMSLPDGYESKLGDRGTRLSGGQQQRIAIMRAILRKPALLIFDEATSSLDTFTEQAIQDAVEVIRKDTTIMIIAHRLSTIRRADKVIVMRDGCVAEYGNHDELMLRQGAYWEMVTHQSLDLVEYEGL